VRSKKAKKRPQSIRLKHAARTGNSMRFPWAIRPQAIVLGVICIMAAAVLIAASQFSHRGDVTSVDAQPEANAPPDKAAMAAQLATKKPVVSKAPATAAAAKTYTVDASMEQTPAVESASKATVVESTPKADVQNLAPVTITGCLELDEETFWLKDTSGVDAPKSRSWRLGFLKKRPSPIELVDAANTLKLQKYVGQRVAATGMLMNREIRARSLQRVGTSCS
jgi:hypothetical protein